MGIFCAPLLLRSNYSFLTGAASLDDILQKAVDYGIESVALTDTNNLYGAIPFYKKALEKGVKPIIGAELIINSVKSHQNMPGERLFLLARNYSGYSNICRIITRINLRINIPEVAVDTKLPASQTWPATLAKFQQGVYFLTENPETARKLSSGINKQYIKLLIVRPGQSISLQRSIYSRAKEMGIKVVGSADVYFLNRVDYPFCRLLAAVNKNALVSDFTGDHKNGEVRFASKADPSNYFHSPREMEKMFSDYPEALLNAFEVAADCNLQIPMGRYVFPKFPLPEGETALTYLYKQCLAGLKWRYGAIESATKNRLQYELEVIKSLGFPEYFLVVGDIVRFARGKEIPVVGRGSGASSIVAYSLGITNVDPIKYNLCFERFMHTLRADYPDLDIDLCWRKRDDVINYVYKTYGNDHVAMISSHNTFQTRSAFRETAKAYGMPHQLVNRYSKFVPRDIGGSLSKLPQTIPIFKDALENCANFKEILKMADRLNGYPRHLGIHSGGIVITDKPIDSYVPLEKAAKGIVITQYDMRAIEEIGLIKIDLLGNRALSTLRETINLVKKERNVELKLEDIPDRDPEAVKLLKEGQTLGCFQIESPGMRNLMKMLKVSSINEVIASLSLIRPGPASGGLKELYVRRARGLEKSKHLHPKLQAILKDSYGIMLYEEDAIRSASAIAGTSLAEGDEFRRSIAKAKTKADLRKVADLFIKKAGKNGVDPEIAKTVGGYIANFASYTFCKAHAAGYGVIAYHGTYMKAHYTVEFITALLNNHQGMYDRRVHVEEARRLGVAILRPCVNKSDMEYSVENGKIRVGLGQVKGLSIKVMKQIAKNRPYTALSDLFYKVNISAKETESLISGGAFDFTGKTRPELMWEQETTFKTGGKLFAINAMPLLNPGPARQPILIDYEYEKKYWDEYKSLEIFIDCHPMKLLKQKLSNYSFIDSGSLPARAGKRARVIGIMSAGRSAETKRNEKMMFITLEDEIGICEVTLFPAIYRKYRHLLKDYGTYIVEGRVENQYGALTITAERIELWKET